jgi:tRNA(Ile)-lysidine synthase
MNLEHFLNNIDNQKLFSPNQKILLAISGGVDSMVMVSLFSKANFNFGIAHCNFKLRGIESDEDAAFVKKMALNLGVEYFEKDFNTRETALLKKQSIQVAARELRYEWFNQLVSENRYDYFATAHQFDDQTETFFINLFRGTGISGLRGILPKNDKCIRPLLFASRNEIEEFAANNEILYRNDSSNDSDKYLRNRIRHQVIPALEETYPDFRKGFVTTFKNLAGAEKILSHEIKKKSETLLEKQDFTIKIELKKLRLLDPLPVYLFEILKPFHFNFSTVEDICEALERIAGKSFFSTTHCLRGERDELVITPLIALENENEQEFFIPETETSINYPVNLSFDVSENKPGFLLQNNPDLAQLDYEKLQFPLKIRKWKPGDAFIPLGMKGKKLLSDFFIDQKFSAAEKQNTWLLVSKNEIVWIIGHRISDKFKITEKTKTILIITPV